MDDTNTTPQKTSCKAGPEVGVTTQKAVVAPRRSGNGRKKTKRGAREAPNNNTTKAEKQIDSRSQTMVTSNDVQVPEGRPVRQVNKVRKRSPAPSPTIWRLLDVDAKHDVKTIERLASAAGCSTRSFSDRENETCLWNERSSDVMNAAASTLPVPKLYEKIACLVMWEEREETAEQEMKDVKRRFDLGSQLAEGMDDVEKIAMISHTQARSQLLNRWHSVRAAVLIAEEVLEKALKGLEEELSRVQVQVPPECRKSKIERQIDWTAKTLAVQCDELMALCKRKQAIYKCLQSSGLEVDANGDKSCNEAKCGTGSTTKGCKTTRATIVQGGHNEEKEMMNLNSTRKQMDGVFSDEEKSTDMMYKSLSDMLSPCSEVSERLDPSCGFLTNEDLCDYWKVLDNDPELEKGICFTFVQCMCPNVIALLRNLLCDKTAAMCGGVHKGGGSSMDLSENNETKYGIKHALGVLGALPSYLKSTKSLSVQKLVECTDTASLNMLKSDAMADENRFPRLMLQCEKLYNELSTEILEQRREKQWLSRTLPDICLRRKRLLELRKSIAEEKGLDMGRKK